MAHTLTRRAAATLFLAGLIEAKTARAAGSSEVTLKVGDQKGGSRALMEAAGVLADLPIRVEWYEFPAAAPLLEALNAGAIDTGVAGDAPTIFAQAAGVPLKIIGAWRSDPVGTAIVVRGDSPVATLSDLKGRRIATGKGSIGHFLALAALERAGLAPGEAEIVFLLPADAKAAFASGAVDAWSTWEPYTSTARLMDGARVVADGRGLSSGLSYQVATERAIAEKREALGLFLARLAAARAWSLDHVDAYARTLAALIGIPEPVAQAWFGQARARFVLVDEQVIADQQRTIDTYARHGVIRQRVLAADAFDLSFNSAVARHVASR
jgi:sulfonate transport system substrate-binding protein